MTTSSRSWNANRTSMSWHRTQCSMRSWIDGWIANDSKHGPKDGRDVAVLRRLHAAPDRHRMDLLPHAFDDDGGGILHPRSPVAPRGCTLRGPSSIMSRESIGARSGCNPAPRASTASAPMERSNKARITTLKASHSNMGPRTPPVPTAHLHEPWLMPSEVQRRIGVHIGVDYPAPIVDEDRLVGTD